jgi:hypothetical protein
MVRSAPAMPLAMALPMPWELEAQILKPQGAATLGTQTARTQDLATQDPAIQDPATQDPAIQDLATQDLATTILTAVFPAMTSSSASRLVITMGRRW